MKTAVVGFPRIGAQRELKFATERYFRGELTEQALCAEGAVLRRKHWEKQAAHGIDWIPSNDFSFYDNMLDMACLLNCVPQRYQALNLTETQRYFAMARGYQGGQGDVKALIMKKWFHTNYHYIVPELEDGCEIRLAGTKPFDEFAEAQALGIKTKPVVIGPYTFLRLARCTGSRTAASFGPEIANAYAALAQRFSALGAEWIQLDEPALVLDLSEEDIAFFTELYRPLLAEKGRCKVLVQTYFGDVRDCYSALTDLPFDGVGLDFCEGAMNQELIRRYGFPKGKVLFAGAVSGSNIWRNDYSETLALIKELCQYSSDLVLGTSCSLLHVPYSTAGEDKMTEEQRRHFAFAEEKLAELAELGGLLSVSEPETHPAYLQNQALRASLRSRNAAVCARVAALTEQDFTRLPAREERADIQAAAFRLPPLPTTTIGSFPQTAEVRENRTAYRNERISESEYTVNYREKIRNCIRQQEALGLDVLVHGEFERNDMVEFFGQRLEGFVITENGWVQSYGTRCVKPPIIWNDISRARPLTVDDAVFAQSLSEKPVKGMLTGPVTILNWSFAREDVPRREAAVQLALAIRDEVLALEAGGIRMIQIDEAALREKLPLRRSEWHSDYLDWAIPAFRLTHSGVQPETQIHTHMCYSEFSDILPEIDAMDADVVSFEASRSNLLIIGALQARGFQSAVGPGVYDIHSPRVPSVEEIKCALWEMLRYLPAEKLWVNPDCGLKTRGEEETLSALSHMVQAAGAVRAELAAGGEGSGM